MYSEKTILLQINCVQLLCVYGCACVHKTETNLHRTIKDPIVERSNELDTLYLFAIRCTITTHNQRAPESSEISADWETAKEVTICNFTVTRTCEVNYIFANRYILFTKLSLGANLSNYGLRVIQSTIKVLPATSMINYLCIYIHVTRIFNIILNAATITYVHDHTWTSF